MGYVLEHYFHTSNNSSFIRQLNLYGWKKLKVDGSFYHPLFHRDMEMDEEVVGQFVRGGSSSVPPATAVRSTPQNERKEKHGPKYRATPKRSTLRNVKKEQQEQYEFYQPSSASDRSSDKRAAFRSACSGIKSVYRIDDVKLEESDAEEDVGVQVDRGAVVLVSSSAKNSAPSEHDEILEVAQPPKKRGPGRPRKQPKRNKEGVKVSPQLASVSHSKADEEKPDVVLSAVTLQRACIEETMHPQEVTTASSEQQPQKRKRGRTKKVKPVFNEAQAVSEKLVSRRPGKYPKPTSEATTVSPVVLQSLGYHVSYAYAHNEAILAEADYDTYWLGRNLYPQPLNLSSGDGFARTSEHIKTTSMWAQHHATAPAPIDTPRNQYSSKRLSFMPIKNAELQTNYFSPIRPQSFARTSDEPTSLVPQTNPTPSTMNYSTPMKDQSDAPFIEFSWRSSASYSYESNPIAGLPSIDIDVDGCVTAVSENQYSNSSTCDGDSPEFIA